MLLMCIHASHCAAAGVQLQICYFCCEHAVDASDVAMSICFILCYFLLVQIHSPQLLRSAITKYVASAAVINTKLMLLLLMLKKN